MWQSLQRVAEVQSGHCKKGALPEGVHLCMKLQYSLKVVRFRMQNILGSLLSKQMQYVHAACERFTNVQVHCGQNIWIRKEAWDHVMSTETDSRFCRAAALTFWSSDVLGQRSVTGTLPNSINSTGRDAFPALTPAKLQALKGNIFLSSLQIFEILCSRY